MPIDLCTVLWRLKTRRFADSTLVRDAGSDGGAAGACRVCSRGLVWAHPCQMGCDPAGNATDGEPCRAPRSAQLDVLSRFKSLWQHIHPLRSHPYPGNRKEEAFPLDHRFPDLIIELSSHPCSQAGPLQPAPHVSQHATQLLRDNVDRTSKKWNVDN